MVQLSGRRAIIVVLALAWLAGPSWATAARATTLNFLAAERPEVFKPAIAAFEKANPGTSVAYTQVPFDSLNAQIQARIGSQDPGIDVYAADTPRIPAFASRGFLLDLSPYQAEIRAVANQTAVGAVSASGKLWAFPMWTSTQLLFFNLDILTKAGVSPPTAAVSGRLTWDAVLDDARKAQNAGSRWGFTFEQVDRYYQLQPLFESANAGSGLTGDGNLKPDITTPAWNKTAEWYSALFASGLSPRGIAPEQTPDLFTNGQVAFFEGGPWNFDKFDAASHLHYAVAPVPYFSGGRPATPTDSWAIGISPYAAHKDIAIKFAKFLTLDPEGNFLTVSANPLPPTNHKAYERYLARIGALGHGIGPAAHDIITYEIANTAVQRPRSVGYVAFEAIMNRTFSDIRNGANAPAALEAAQSQLVSTLARIR